MKCFIDGCKNKVTAEQVVRHEVKVTKLPHFQAVNPVTYYACEEHRMRNRPDLIQK